jgi:Phasin protein
MVQKPSRSDVAAAAQQVPGELLKLGEAQTEAMLAMQKELLGAYEQISRAWLDRVKSEADLWSELASKMSGARSIPDALGAYRECVVQRMQMAADDGRRLFDDTQKMISTITRAMSKGLPTGSM